MADRGFGAGAGSCLFRGVAAGTLAGALRAGRGGGAGRCHAGGGRDAGSRAGVWGSYLPWLAGCAPAAASLYAVVRWLRRDARPPIRSGAGQWRGGDPRLGLAAGAGQVWDATAWAGAALVAAIAAVCCAEVPAGSRRLAAELGLFATTAAVQRAVLFTGPGPGSDGPDWFWTLQWYVVLAGVLGALRLVSGFRSAGRVLWSVGAGLLTLSGLGIIFGGDPARQLGLGAAGRPAHGRTGLGRTDVCPVGRCGRGAVHPVGDAQYTFALLALIAAALIALAVWRLNRSRPEAVEPARQREPAEHG